MTERRRIVVHRPRPRLLERVLHGPPTWFAFVSAGLCFVAAGYLATTLSEWRRLYDAMGVELPLLTQELTAAPILSPLAVLAVGVTLLGLSRTRFVRGDSPGGAAFVLATLVAGVLAAALIMGTTLPMAEVQKCLQQ